MTQYSTNFSEYTAAAQPSDWTERFVTANITWLVQNSVVSGVTGGKVLQLTRTTANGRSMLSWDDIDGDANRDDIEILFKSQHPTIASGMRAMARGSGSAGSENAWYGGHNATTEACGGYVSGTFSAGSTATTFAPTAGTWFWTRARWNNGTSGQRQLRMWDDGDAEPGTWDIDDVDTAILGVGWAGLFSFSQNNTGHIVDFFSVGTNGDTAPGPGLTVSLGLASETDSALPLGGVINVELGIASEANTALALGVAVPFDQYEGGNMDATRAVVVDSHIGTPTITLYARPGVNTEGATPTDIFYNMSWRCTGMNGKTPTFRLNIDDSSPIVVYGSAGWPSGWKLWFTYDAPHTLTTTYQQAANTSVVGNFQECSHSSAFTQDEVYFFTRLPYTPSLVQAHTDSIKADSLVTETASAVAFGGTEYAYGQSAATTRDDDAFAVPAINLLSYRISNDGANPLDGKRKRRCVLVSGQHASEPQGNWQLQGFVDYLLAGSATAIALVRDWEFFVYPMVNTSGRWGSAYRGTLQSGERDEDPNRDWPGGSTPGLLDVVTATKNAITTDTGDVFEAFLDTHGRLSLGNSIFHTANTINTAYVANVNAVETVLSVDITTAGTADNYYRSTVGIPLCATPEGAGFVSGGSDLTVLGEALAQGLNTSFVNGDFPIAGGNIVPILMNYYHG